MFRSRRPLLSLALLSACLHPACGGSKGPSSPTPVVSPTPRPRLTSTLRQGSFTGLEQFFLLSIPFNILPAGDIDATVDWTFASNNLDLLLTRGTNACENSDEEIDFDLCTVVATQLSTTTKPERMQVPGLAVGDYTLYIGNAGPGVESLSYTILHTYSAPNASLLDGQTASLRLGAPRVGRAVAPWR